MKFIEKFKFWLINTPMFEMAYYRKDAIDTIRSLSGIILLHIIKVKYLKNNPSENHWKSEIKAFFRKVNSIRIKPKNKKFTIEEYMNFLFVEPYCTSESSFKKDRYIFIDSYLQSILSEINYDHNTNLKISEINKDDLIDFFKSISIKIASDEDYFTIIDDQ